MKQYMSLTANKIPRTKRQLRQTHVTVSPILQSFSESALWSLNKILKLNNNS